MIRHVEFSGAPLALCLLLATAALMAPAYAAWNAAPSRPAVIATVDLERVFNEIDRRAQAEIDLEQRSQEYRKQAEDLRNEAELLKQDLELLVVGTEQYEKAEKKWTQTVLDYSALIEFTKVKLDLMLANARKEIYEQIIEEADRFANANGIDLILSDDSAFAIAEGTDLQIVQQLAMRRVVFSRPEFDVTNQLITWINQR